MITVNDIAAERKFLVSYAIHLGASRADAEDVAQNALINAFLNIDNYNGAVDGPRAWLSVILRNAYFDFCRRAKAREKRHEGYRLIANLVSPCAGENSCEVDRVIGAVQRLSPGQRDAFSQQALGAEYHEVAESLGVRIGTVKSRISRAREALQA